MSRRSKEAAEQAAMQASEAGRVLQAQRSAPEPTPEPQSEKPEGTRPAPRNEPRRLAMEEITDRHERTMNGAEAPQVPDPVPPSPEEMLAAQHAAQPKQEEAVEPKVEAVPQAEATPQEAALAETVRVKVDGEVFDVPKAEVEDYGGIKAYQIAKSAENRAEKLNRTLAETRQQQQALFQLLQQAAPKAPAQPTHDELIAQKIDVIRYGSPEESAAALREVLNAATSAGRVDPNALEQRTMLKFDMKMAANNFRQEFSDVLANPMLQTLAAVEEQKRLNSLQAVPADWNVFYRSIGNELRALVGPKQYQPETQPATPTADTTSQQQPSNTSPAPSKEVRKASIVNLPTAASRAELPKEPKPETREDILNGMKQKRGIPIG